MQDSSTVETIIRKPPNNVAQVKVSGFAWDGTFKSSGCPEGSNNCPNSLPYCSTSGQFPDDDGKSIVNFDRQTLRSQTHCNEIAGRKFGALNNLYPEVRIKTHGNYFGVFDVAFPYYYIKEYQVADTIRGILITNKAWLRSVTTTIDSKKGISITNIVLEIEVLQDDGIYEECVTDYPSGFTPPTIETPPVIDGCGEPIYTAGTSGFHRYLCNTWLQTTTENTYDMRADPYTWENVWRCGYGYIKRSTVSGDTWVDLTPPDPPNDAGDTPAPQSQYITFEHMDVGWT